jgi:putative transposase
MRGCLLTHREKNRLVRFAKNLGPALNELATIVHPSTIRQGIRDALIERGCEVKKNADWPWTVEQIARCEFASRLT